MIRYDTISSLPDVMHIVDYSPMPDADYEPSLTDKSHFVPTSEAVKRLSASGALSDAEIESSFDFRDGKDTGMKTPVARMRGLDIAELSQGIKAEQAKISAQLSKDKEVASHKKMLADLARSARGSDTQGVATPVVPVASNAHGVVQ